MPYIVTILCLSEDLVLPLSGFLYDDHYVKSDPGWCVGWVRMDFHFGGGRAGTAFYVGLVPNSQCSFPTDLG